MAAYRDHDLNPPMRDGQCKAEEEGLVWSENIDAPILQCQLDAGHKGSHVHPNLTWREDFLHVD